MFLINLFNAVGMDNSKPTFARDARKSEMGRLDLVMTWICEKLGIINRQE